jgi:hypothetical protein
MAAKKTTAKTHAAAKKAASTKPAAQKAPAKKAAPAKAVAKKAAPAKQAAPKKAAVTKSVAKSTAKKIDAKEALAKAVAKATTAKDAPKGVLTNLLDDETGGSEPTDVDDIAVVLAAEEGSEWSAETWDIDEDDELKIPGYVAGDDVDDVDGSEDEPAAKKPKARSKKVDDDLDDEEELDELLVKGVEPDEVCCTGCFLIVKRWRIADFSVNLCRDCA